MTTQVSEPYHALEKPRKRTNKDWAITIREGNIATVKRFRTEEEADAEVERLEKVARADPVTTQCNGRTGKWSYVIWAAGNPPYPWFVSHYRYGSEEVAKRAGEDDAIASL